MSPSGERITVDDGTLHVPDTPIIPYIEGDGVGADIWAAARPVFDAAVETAYDGERAIEWTEVLAGEKAKEHTGDLLPENTVETIREHRVAIKGPLTTPVGAGFRSLNVALRQKLDLYANVRPTYYIDGVPSPMKNPEQMDMVTFRENTEDVYAGIEWEAGTEGAEQVRAFVEEQMGFDDTIHDGPVGIGIKPITEFGTKRLVREAIDYALESDGHQFVTLVHKGNIMKFTEGAFRDWGYEVAREEYGDAVITEDTLWEERDGDPPEDAVVVNDRIADNMLQQVQTRTDQYDVLAMPNLNGDYLSDACGAQIGGLGVAPGANFGDAACLAEPVHGSANKYAGQDKVNPSALILSGRLMFEYMGWDEASAVILESLAETIQQKRVTYDFERNLEDAELLKCSEFGQAVVENMG
ncbi:isocitrate dehydrogenase [Salinibacter ruber]|jgi:isocitrate dehydrogenase (NADP) (EC 1.1.1.42)|uniref:Isocitrate dehydrogenase [NADP] n=2 Tax=Salinibacter ruber TaxID=146919 RepID=D5HAQ5_SALRM|nr:isocitrate dehydrogenase (NADP(+)) [Salinibacter ruber]MBB4069907.1 isocitrate dehydrogenase [Salinibacter ruber]MCS3639967.1 isocitrate dehydrogenase [Salinibacter ruber]MCS3664428.1 isocitrate dehydrogenase [Salinibacter ruber]MCS3754155.1 isocitrate dehydrogenase [Salinibacter ruber]MCS3830501.1 isocitrate dehydrogenase [Salinibacter ruber]